MVYIYIILYILYYLYILYNIYICMLYYILWNMNNQEWGIWRWYMKRLSPEVEIYIANLQSTPLIDIIGSSILDIYLCSYVMPPLCTMCTYYIYAVYTCYIYIYIYMYVYIYSIYRLHIYIYILWFTFGLFLVFTPETEGLRHKQPKTMTNKWCQSCSVLRTAAAVHIWILKFPKVGFSEGSLWNDLLQWLFPGFSSFLDGFLLVYLRINLYWLVVSTNPSEKSWTSSVGIMIIPNWMDKFTECSKIWKSVGMMTFPIYGKI